VEKLSGHEQVLVALRKIVRSIELRSRQLVRRHGLTGPQMLILKTLLQSGESTIGRLADRMSLSQATVTDILNRLESRGLITRSRSEADRRCVYIRLTRQAKDLLLTSDEMAEDMFASRFAALKEWEQLQLIASLNRISELMDVRSVESGYASQHGKEPAPSGNNQPQGGEINKTCVE